MITSAGLGSGIDVESIITGLMNLERRPLQAVETEKSGLDVKISGVGKLKSALSDFQAAAEALKDQADFSNFEASSSNDDYLSAEVTTLAAEESHEIKVINLATAHRLASNTFDDPDADIANGVYTFGAAGETFDIIIDDTNNTLSGLREAINTSVDNTGVNASLINEINGTRLILTAAESGEDNAITAPGWFNEITAASDAEIEINGFTAISASNSVTNVVPGLTLDLKKTTEPDEVITVDITSNKEAMLENMQTFVDSYNNLNDIMQQLEQKELKGEGLRIGIESSIRTQLFTSLEKADGTTNSVFDFGATFNKDGLLILNDHEFTNSIDENYHAMMGFFTGEDGFAERIVSTLDGYTESNGILSVRTDGYESRINYLDDRSERLEYRLESTEKRLRREYTELDKLMAQLGNTSNYMAQQLASLPSLYASS